MCQQSQGKENSTSVTLGNVICKLGEQYLLHGMKVNEVISEEPGIGPGIQSGFAFRIYSENK